jgi:purine nucleosidase
MPAKRSGFLLGVVAWLATSTAWAAPRHVVLTTDAGADMDDQWALAHLVLTPELDVRAVITTHTGKFALLPAPAAESSARIARDVLDHLPLRRRPVVIPGSSVALTSRAALPNRGVERIIRESRSFDHDHRLSVIVIGAATDVASALLTDRALSRRIEIIAMGFNTCADGGDVFNVVNDPLAWQVILDSDVPVVLGDSAVTKHDLAMTSEQAHAALDRSGAPGRYLAHLFDDWLRTRSDLVGQVMGDTKHWPVWDEVTVAYVLGMTTQMPRDRPALRSDLSFGSSAKSGTITCVSAVDGSRLWRDLANRLAATP